MAETILDEWSSRLTAAAISRKASESALGPFALRCSVGATLNPMQSNVGRDAARYGAVPY